MVGQRVVTKEMQKLKNKYDKHIAERRYPTVRSNKEINSIDFDSEYEDDNKNIPVIGRDDIESIPVDSAFLLVYAASGNGRISKFQTLGSPIQVSAAGKAFMADMPQRESARWVEALDRLIVWGWAKATSYKRQIFELTGTGYVKSAAI